MIFALGMLGCSSKTPQKTDASTTTQRVDTVPKTLAIFPFDNNSVTTPEKYSPLSKGVAAMLITDLSREGTGMKLIERAKIDTLLKEVALSQSGTIDQATAIQVGKILGAQAIAFGSFMVLDTTVRIDLRIINVETSELIMADRVMGSSSNFIDLEQKLAQNIARSLKVAFKPEPASGTSGLGAALYFSEGVQAYDTGDIQMANHLFDKAISADPSYQDKVRNIRGL